MHQRERIAGRAIGVVSAALLGFAAILAPVAANAAQPSSIQFTGEQTVTADFGDSWSFTLAVTAGYFDEETLLRAAPTAGTVDVFLSGIGDAYATDLPIQPDGLVYFAQPLSKPLLAAGSYQVSAVFTPAPGTYFDSSQTSVSATLEIAPLKVVPTVTATNDPAIAKKPVITASIDGAYTEARGGSPAGTWSFTVTEVAGSEVFSTDVAQVEGTTEPIRVEVDAKLSSGTDYTVATVFTPVDELAGGLEVAPVPSTSFSTPGTTFVDTLTTRLPIPGWLVLAIGALVLVLVVTVIVLGVRLAKLPIHKSPPRVPGEPMDVEELSWNEAGISDEPTGQRESPTSWALSDAGDLTERLDVPPAQPATDK